jgi:apolipoprotein D and lipocalin family protein
MPYAPSTASAIFVLACFTVSASAQEPISDTEIDVDPKAYTGLWYEIARTPAPFQERCNGGVTAYYHVIDDETLSVLNRCDLPDGDVERIKGTATVLNARFNAFNVNFPESPPEEGANYLIHAVGPVEDGTYAWAAIRGPGEGYGWILARDPELENEAFDAARQALIDTGINPDRLQMTEQPPDRYDPDEN